VATLSAATQDTTRPQPTVATPVATAPEPATPDPDMTRKVPPLPSLTGMRWLAAALVFGFHVRLAEYFGGPRSNAVLDVLFTAGVSGVSFFFILSGFVLTWSVRAGDDSRRFWRRRIARVYPLHVVTGVLALVIALTLAPGTLPDMREAALNMLLVHAWSPVPHDSQTLNPVSWSLACEAFFYALFPVLFYGVRRLGVRGLRLVGLASVAAVAVISIVATAGSFHFYPVARLPEFVLGVVLACLVRQGRWRGPGLAVSVAILVTGYLVAAWVPSPFQYSACTILGFALVIPAAATADLRGRHTFLARPTLVRLGELSFAFYMIHILVVRVGENLFARHPRLPAVEALAWSALVFSVALGLSWVLYEAIENPARKLLTRHWRRSRPAEAPVSPGVGPVEPGRRAPGVPEPRDPAAGGNADSRRADAPHRAADRDRRADAPPHPAGTADRRTDLVDTLTG
jgi:peptidoglycan/LPS O-acetylase OafA/YrhL